MSRKHLASGAWLLVVGLAFALGWSLKSTPDSAGVSSKDGSRTIGKAPGSSSGPDGTGNGLSADGAEKSSAAEPFATLETSPALDSASIDELGKKFKSSLDPIERRLAFAALLEGLTPENALEVREQIEHLPSGSSEFQEFHYAWGKIAGTEAVLNGAGTDKPDMAPALAGWASADPEAAMAWLENLDMENNPAFDPLLKDRNIPADRMRGHLVEGLVHGLSNADPDMAAKFVLELGASGNKRAGEMLGMIAGKYLQLNGPEASAAWAANLPDDAGGGGSLRASAMSKVAGAFAREDPAAAAAWAANLPGADQHNRVLGQIGHHLARQDGLAAVQWLSTTAANSPGHEGTYWATFDGWAASNPEEASGYLASENFEGRDYAIGGLISRVRWEDPEGALAWAAEIGDQNVQAKAFVMAGQSYFRRYPTAANEWLPTSGLSERVQQAILKGARDQRNGDRK